MNVYNIGFLPSERLAEVASVLSITKGFFLKEESTPKQLRERVKSQPTEVTDGVLIQRTRADDQEAFEKLVQRYSGSLFHLHLSLFQ